MTRYFATVSERSRVALPTVSAARTVKVCVPFDLGVPLMTPEAAARLSPGGNEPAATCQVTAPCASTVASVAL
jgi:hypothetical protein